MFGRVKNDGVAVSVLTPVYNVERYLKECLDSLKAQTLKDIEFICINDGSTDDSLEILKAYAESDSRFKIIDKPNSGYGASMNAGLDVAQGEYIGIVESDDVASPNMFKTLYKYARKYDCDLVKSNYYEYDGSQNFYMEPFINFPYKKVFDPKAKLDVVKVLPIIWAGLYRRQMIVDNNIRFAETPGASFQDTSFVFRNWVTTNRALLLKDGFLHYRVNRNESSVNSNKKVFEVCGEYAVSEAFLEEKPERLAIYGKLLNVMRMDTYRWNYNRITQDCREGFCEKWAQEFRDEEAKGLMDADYFSPSDWALAHQLMDDSKAFVAAHPEL